MYLSILITQTGHVVFTEKLYFTYLNHTNKVIQKPNERNEITQTYHILNSQTLKAILKSLLCVTRYRQTLSA